MRHADVAPLLFRRLQHDIDVDTHIIITYYIIMTTLLIHYAIYAILCHATLMLPALCHCWMPLRR